MDIGILKNLLIEVSHLSRHYEKVTQLSGENFNIFEVLNLQTSEVRSHSAFLAELLNPRGSHGQADLFLKFFVKQFHIENFDTKTAFAEIEKHTGRIDADYTEGGRIDILITDGQGKHIIIENKIYAGDQKNQLIRYNNFDPTAQLFYLTLFGDEPSEFSTNGELDPERYQVISYKQDIIEWLENCKKEAVSLPIIRETIAQYSNLLRALTNQTIKEKMKEEIKFLLLNHPEYIEAFETCSQTINSIIQETKPKFKSLFDELFPPCRITIQNNASIYIHWGEDSDGIHFGYEYHESGQNKGGSDKARELSNILKKTGAPYQIYSNNYHFGWFNPNPVIRGQRFEHLNKKEIIKMSADDAYLREFIMALIIQEKEIRQALLASIGILKSNQGS